MSMHPNRNLFKEFANSVFVETGSYRGDGIQLAINAGFEKIFSIDIDPENIEFCRNRFDLINNPDPRIILTHGDSAECLWPIIGRIEDRITFWLDSHWQMLEGTEKGKNPFPLRKELNQIRQHKRNDHTILIDDMLIMQRNITGYDQGVIEEDLRRINRGYKLEYFANPVIDNILVAYV